MRKGITFILFLLCVAVNLYAVSADSLKTKQSIFHVDGKINLMSEYIWRGARICGVNISPELNFHIENFTAQFYGFVAFDGKYHEIDIDLSYKWKDFAFHLADYYHWDDTYRANYFDWSKAGTSHVLETIFCYEPVRLPFYVKFFTFWYGDWTLDENLERDRLSFSSYLELEAHHSFGPDGKYGKASFIMGNSVFPGAYTYYTNWFMPVHLELKYAKTFYLEHVSFPLSASFIINPYAGTCFIGAVAGVAF